MARIIGEAGIQIEPETASFASELRGDISRDLAAATAGQDRTVRVRVTTDADVAERQIRNAIAKVQQVTNAVFDKTRARAQQLYTYIEQQVIIKTANKIREWTQKSIARVKLMMTPFFEYMRQKVALVQQGWQKFRDIAANGADAVAQKWRQGMAVVSAQMSRVRAAGYRVFSGIADAAEPHIARIGRAITALRKPFDVVRAYGIGAFRVLGDSAGRYIGRPIGRAFQSAAGVAGTYLRQIRDDATSAFNTATARAGAFGRATAAVFAAAGRGSDEFSREVRRAGLTVVQTEQGMQAAAEELTKAHQGLNDVQAASTKMEKGLEIAEQRLQAAWKASELAITQRARAEDDLRTVQAEYAAQAQKVDDIERKLAADRDSGTVSASKLQFQEQSLNAERDKGWEVADRLEKAQDKLSKAQEREHDTTANLLEVEQRGIEVRNKADDAADRLTEAHGRLTKATEDSTRATQLHEAAERRHLGVLGRVSAQLRKTATSSRVGSVAMRGLAGAAGLMGAGMRVVSSIGEKLTGVMGSVGDAVSEVGTKAIGLLKNIPALVQQFAYWAVIGGAVTYALGAVAAAVSALPALLLGAGAALGVVILGMDGIKKAYNNGLKPALDALKKQISDVFEQKLTPAFRKLSTDLLPQLTDKLKTLATSVANVAVHLVDLVTKGENVAKINKLIDTMAQIIASQVDPALQKLVQSFIDLGTNAQILNTIGGMFTDLIGKTANWLAEMNRTGEATRAVGALRDVLGRVEDLFFRVATAAARFFSDATPGVSKLVDSAGRLVDVIGRMGGAFGKAAGAAADLINSIPQSTLDAIGDSITRLGDALERAGKNKDLQDLLGRLADLLPKAIDGLTQLTDAVTTLSSVLGPVIGFIDDATSAIGGLSGILNDIANPIGGAIHGLSELGKFFGIVSDDATTGGQGVHDGFIPPVQALPGDAAAAVAPLPGALNDPLAQAKKAAELAGKGVHDGVTTPLAPLPGQVGQVFSDVNAQGDKLHPLPGTALNVGQGVSDGLINPINPLPGQAGAVFDGVNAAGDKMNPLPVSVGADAHATGQAVVDGLQPMPPAADAAFSGVATAAQTNLDAARTTAESSSQAISTAVVTGVNAAADAAQAGMGRVSAAVRTGMDQAAAAAEGGGGRLRTAVSDACNQAADAAQAGMGRVSEAVRTGMDQAAKAAEDGGKRIADGLKSSIDAAVASIEAGMTRVSTAVEQGIQRAVQSATQGGQQIRQVLTQTFQQVVQITEQSWQRIVQAFEQGGQRAVNSARNTGQQVVQTFQSQAGPMYSAGYTLIQRLTDGMIAAGAQATAAAARIAASIKAQFPSSPAKEGPLSGAGDPLRSGGTIVARLAAGIAANAAVVTAALQPILQSVSSRVAGFTPTATVSVAGRPELPSGVPDVRRIVGDAIRGATTTQTSSSGVGGGDAVAALQQIAGILTAMRGDIVSGGYGPDMLARLDDLITAVTGRSGTAASRAAGARDLSELGAFP